MLAALAAAITVAAGTSLPCAGAPADPAKKQAVADTPTVVTPSVHPRRVIAYYFHTTLRCATCRALEAYSREAIESAFANELKSGRLLWKVVNVEVKGNEHFVKDYRLYTKSLILVSEVRGKPARWKNLEKIWQLVRDKPEFLRYVQKETKAYMTERS